MQNMMNLPSQVSSPVLEFNAEITIYISLEQYIKRSIFNIYINVHGSAFYGYPAMVMGLHTVCS